MKQILGISLCALLFCACANKQISTQTNPSSVIFLDPSQIGAGKVIFVSASDDNLCAKNLKTRLNDMLKEKGYQITLKPSEADITLQTQVVFCDYKTEAGTSSTIGAVAGGAIGLGTSAYNNAGGWARAGWTALGAAAGYALGQLAKEETWNLQVALRIQINNEMHDTTLHAKASRSNFGASDVEKILEEQVTAQVAQIF